jgi:acyl transferase domain-containing protein
MANGQAKSNDVAANGLNGYSNGDRVAANGSNGNGVVFYGSNGHESELPAFNGHAEVETPEANLARNDINGHHTIEPEPLHVRKSLNGINGTNGIKIRNGTSGRHSVKENFEDETTAQSDPKLFVLSARSETSLKLMTENLQKWVSAQSENRSYFADLAHTLLNRRTPMQFRFSTAAATPADLLNSLSQKPRITKTTTNFHSVFVFTGQGAQWAQMGKELAVSHPVFRQSILKSDEMLKSFGAEWSLREELSSKDTESRIGQAEISQPSTTGLQIALVDLLESFGVSPEIVVGHSSGEIAAAYAAGILDHKTALEISYHRGFMSQAVQEVMTSKGSMIAVGLGEDEVLQYIEHTRTGLVSVACINSPVSTTVSGDESAIDELKELWDEALIFNRKLKIDTAYHSHHMQKVGSKYLHSIAHIKAGKPRSSVKFYSCHFAAENKRFRRQVLG